MRLCIALVCMTLAVTTANANAADVLLAARRIGLKATGRLDLGRAVNGLLPLPCIISLNSEEQPATAGFAVFAKAADTRFVLHAPSAGRAVVLDLPAMAAHITGHAIFIASRASLADALARFDFTWFIPALVRYQRLPE